MTKRKEPPPPPKPQYELPGYAKVILFFVAVEAGIVAFIWFLISLK